MYLAVTAVAGEGQAVYYLAFGALAEGASKHEAQEPGGTTAGLVNLYRYVPATGATPARTSLVTAVDTLDNPMVGAVCDDGVLEVAPCSDINWYTTPDGRYLLFGASVPIDGYNEASGCPVPLAKQYSSGADGRCCSLYRYDAQAAEHGEQPIVCVSCNPDRRTAGRATRSSPARRHRRRRPRRFARCPTTGNTCSSTLPTRSCRRPTNGMPRRVRVARRRRSR